MRRHSTLARLCSGAGVGLIIWSVTHIEGAYRSIRWLAIASESYPEARDLIQQTPETLGLYTLLLAVGLGLIVLPAQLRRFVDPAKGDDS